MTTNTTKYPPPGQVKLIKAKSSQCSLWYLSSKSGQSHSPRAFATHTMTSICTYSSYGTASLPKSQFHPSRLSSLITRAPLQHTPASFRDLRLRVLGYRKELKHPLAVSSTRRSLTATAPGANKNSKQRPEPFEKACVQYSMEKPSLLYEGQLCSLPLRTLSTNPVLAPQWSLPLAWPARVSGLRQVRMSS